MKTYTIRGEYGIQMGDDIELAIQAKSEEDAIRKFIKKVKADHPHLWKRMGEHNIYIIDITT